MGIVSSVILSLWWKLLQGSKARSTSNAQRPWIVSQVALGGADRTQPADLDGSGRPRASMGACRSRTNADDRLPADPLGRIGSGDGIVEGRPSAGRASVGPAMVIG